MPYERIENFSMYAMLLFLCWDSERWRDEDIKELVFPFWFALSQMELWLRAIERRYNNIVRGARWQRDAECESHGIDLRRPMSKVPFNWFPTACIITLVSYWHFHVVAPTTFHVRNYAGKSWPLSGHKGKKRIIQNDDRGRKCLLCWVQSWYYDDALCRDTHKTIIIGHLFCARE